jgi:hypothetical protein
VLSLLQDHERQLLSCTHNASTQGRIASPDTLQGQNLQLQKKTLQDTT